MKKDFLNKLLEADKAKRYLYKALGSFIGAGILFIFLIVALIIIYNKEPNVNIKYVLGIIGLFGGIITLFITLGIVDLFLYKKQNSL